MADVVIAEFMDEAAVARIANRFPTHYDPLLVNARDDLLARLENARALIVRNRLRVCGEVLDRAGQLRCIGRVGVGLDNIDLELCRSRGISVYPAIGADNQAVAEYVVHMALTLTRGATLASADVAAGKWPRQFMMGREVAGRELGLVGFGATARAVARNARALGMKTAAFDPFVAATDPAWEGVRNASFEDLLETADIISLHVPLTAQTRHIIDSGACQRMKDDAVVINSARGGVVDEHALAGALKAGTLGGAALDVFETEPLTAEAGALFADVPNLILTPHIAGVTEESNLRVSDMVAERVISHLEEQG